MFHCWLRTAAVLIALGAAGPALAQGTGTSRGLQPTPGSTAPPSDGSLSPPGQPSAPVGNGARFVENCQQALERGNVPAGCQGSLYANEIARLKEEALRSNNPALLTLLGDAYQGNRSAISDVGQAYRWYLLAAVRGDPRAMQRLSELYKGGRGTPNDNVKALGYARLAQRLAVPGSKTATEASRASASLAGTMASEEVKLADRFAVDLEATLRREGAQAADLTATTPADSAAAGWQGGITLREGAQTPAAGPAIPGMSILTSPPPPPAAAR
jgi:hypothetical protein